jgi:photosystem II stability/assembly factor-like uncharacterized protein
MGLFAGASMAVGVILSVMACSAAKAPAYIPAPAQEVEVGTYAAQLQFCVSRSSTRAQADVCRETVEAYWCGPAGILADAGACGDGGGR